MPKNDAIKVCATDTHTLNVEKPAELVNTGSGSAISASWFITAIMLGGVFIATRTRTVKK